MVVCLLSIRRMVTVEASPAIYRTQTVINDTVIMFRNLPCRPKSDSELAQQLGESFSSQRMSLDEIPEEESSLLQSTTGDRDLDVYLKDDDLLLTRRNSQHSQSNSRRTRNRESRKHLRHSRRKRHHKKLPWSCEMKTVWKRMKQGVFPPYIKTGECVQKKCMHRMYRCKPKKYVVKILKRDVNSCNPVPTSTLEGTYEESWKVDHYLVTVCCECAKEIQKRPKRWDLVFGT